MIQDTEKTKVIFREFKDGGEVIAFFPELTGSNDPMTCMSYIHIGQHGAANTNLVFHWTRPAYNFADLMAELESLGYNLQVCHRFTQAAQEKRRAAVAYLSQGE